MNPGPGLGPGPGRGPGQVMALMENFNNLISKLVLRLGVTVSGRSPARAAAVGNLGWPGRPAAARGRAGGRKAAAHNTPGPTTPTTPGGPDHISESRRIIESGV